MPVTYTKKASSPPLKKRTKKLLSACRSLIPEAATAPSGRFLLLFFKKEALPCLLAAALASCGPAPKRPSDADVAAFIAQSEPGYLRVGNVTTQFERANSNGAWRVHVTYTLHTNEELYAPVPEARQERLTFDQAVSRFEAFRANRIDYVDRLGLAAGLMRQGDAAPEPAVAVRLVNHAGQDLKDSTTLRAQPDGAAWKFYSEDAESLRDDQIGAPLANLRAAAPHTQFVTADTQEERDLHNRMLGFLSKLASLPPP